MSLGNSLDEYFSYFHTPCQTGLRLELLVSPYCTVLHDQYFDLIFIFQPITSHLWNININFRGNSLHAHSKTFRYCQSIFCLLHRPNLSDMFDLCLHWASVVRGWDMRGTHFHHMWRIWQYNGEKIDRLDLGPILDMQIQGWRKVWKSGWAISNAC